MRIALVRSIAVAVLFGVAAPLSAQTQPAGSTLFQNVRIFDGTGRPLSGPSHVLVRGNKIERISSTPIVSDRPANAVVIEGGGRTRDYAFGVTDYEVFERKVRKVLAR